MSKDKQELNIDKIVGTKDKTKQAEVFLKLVNAPVVDLIVRFDTRNNQVMVGGFGGQLEVAAIYKILDLARDTLREQELKTLAEKKDQPAE